MIPFKKMSLAGKEISPMYLLTGVGIFLIVLAMTAFQYTFYYQGLLVTGALVSVLPILLTYYLEYSKIKKIEVYLPDFLRDVSESVRAGMTLPTAFYNASQGDYGPLSKDMRKIAAQLSWGISMPEALTRYAKKTKSKLVKQALMIIVESYQSGGEIATVLETVSTDVKTLKELEMERKSKLSVYIISTYFIFFLFLGIILILTKTFLPATPQLQSVSAILGRGGGVPMSEEDFRTVYFHLCLIEAFFAGLISGQMGEASIIAGIKHSVILVIVTILAFQFLVVAEPFQSKVANEILLIPPGAAGSSAKDIVYTFTADVTNVDVAREVKRVAEEKNAAEFRSLTPDMIKFTYRSCTPCNKGDLIVSEDSIIVKKPSKVKYSIYNTGNGYNIMIEDAGG